MIVHPFHKRTEPVFGNLDVRIDQKEIFRCRFFADLSECFIISSGESEIPLEYECPDMREFLSQKCCRAVCGGIVRDNDFRALDLCCRTQKPRKEIPEESLRVPVQYYDGRLHINGIRNRSRLSSFRLRIRFRSHRHGIRRIRMNEQILRGDLR